MGNCQAVDAATLIVQHQNGKVDRFYCPVNAGEIMKTNPGHYVALLLSSTLYPNQNTQPRPNKPTAVSTSSTAAGADSSLRITRIKLLRPSDTLLLGHSYRLITSQEVMKGLSAKKQAKHNRNGHSSGVISSELGKDNKVISKSERNKGKSTSTGSNSGRTKTWQPSLNSISEGVNGNGS